jgi:hypothetical protein
MVDELAIPGSEIAEKGPEFERAIGEPADVRNRHRSPTRRPMRTP